MFTVNLYFVSGFKHSIFGVNVNILDVFGSGFVTMIWTLSLYGVYGGLGGLRGGDGGRPTDPGGDGLGYFGEGGGGGEGSGDGGGGKKGGSGGSIGGGGGLGEGGGGGGGGGGEGGGGASKSKSWAPTAWKVPTPGALLSFTGTGPRSRPPCRVLCTRECCVASGPICVKTSSTPTSVSAQKAHLTSVCGGTEEDAAPSRPYRRLKMDRPLAIGRRSDRQLRHPPLPGWREARCGRF